MPATLIAPGFSTRSLRCGPGFTTASALWRRATGGEAFVAGLFTSPQDQAALDAERRRFLRSLFEDALAFGGLKMIRRIFGLAHVEDLESIADPARRAICERKALRLARTLVVEAAKFSGVADVIEAAKRAMMRAS